MPQTVLVAQGPIPAGTSGDVLASSHLVKPASVEQSKAEAGAITTASELQGQVAATDITTGEQLTTADFTASGTYGNLSSSQGSAPWSSPSTRRARWAIRSSRVTRSTSTRWSPRQAVLRSSTRS